MKQKSIKVSVLLFYIGIVFSFSIIVFSYSGCTVGDDGDTQYQEIDIDTTYSATSTTSEDLLARFTPTTSGFHIITVSSIDTADITLILSSNDDFTDSITTASSNGIFADFIVPTAPDTLSSGTEYYLSLANSGTEDAITIFIAGP